MTTRLAASVAAMLALAFAGCGGDDEDKGTTTTAAPSSGGSDTQQVEAAVKGYAGALVKRDGGKACGFMTPQLQNDMLAAMRKDPQASKVIGDKNCAEALNFIFGATKGNEQIEKAIEAVGGIKVSGVKVSGDKADAKWAMNVSGQKLEEPTNLRKVDGKWLVNCCLGPGGG